MYLFDNRRKIIKHQISSFLILITVFTIEKKRKKTIKYADTKERLRENRTEQKIY